MDDLFANVSTIIELMPRDRNFTSHDFILALAQRYQKAYVAALSNYCTGNTPFQTLHSQISLALYEFPTLVQHVGEVDSEDIFRKPGRCAIWKRV